MLIQDLLPDYDVEASERKLCEWSDAYYNDGVTIVTDREFDDLWQQHMLARGQTSGDKFWDKSILNRVGAKPRPDSGFAKRMHSSPMLSLDNLFVKDGGDISDVLSWIKKLGAELAGKTCNLLAEPKVDGFSLKITYAGGRLLSAVTRGDGREGDDVTENALAADLVPVALTGAPEDLLEIAGEVVLPFAAFETINERQRAAGEEEYANPRNAASGILRRKDPAKVVGQGLQFLAYNVSLGGDFSSHRVALGYLRALGLQTTPYKWVGFDGSIATGEPVTLEWLKEIAACPFPTDGVVLKLDEILVRSALGNTSRAPKWAVAVKFEQEEAETDLLEITVQVGRSGVLTPVAELTPVLVDGSTVSRATLHNVDQVNRLGIRVGDRVVIRKAGAIIPEVLRVAGKRTLPAPTFELDKHIKGKCPSCGSTDLESRKDGEATKWFCANTAACPAQMAARIEHLASRRCLDLDQLGGEACDALANRAAEYGIKHPFDVLNLTHQEFAQLSWTTESGGKMTFGESRADKVMEAIKNIRKKPLNRWIFALGIPTIGENTSREISRLCKDQEHFVNNSSHQFGVFKMMVTSLAGDKKNYEHLKQKFAVSHHLGPVSLHKLIDFMAKPENLDIVNRIPATVTSDNYNPEPPAAATGPLAGKTFVITGTLSVPRDAIKELVETNGGKVSDSISAKTSVLIAGDKAGSKMEKAKKLGVEVWDEAKLREAVA